jgi:hypothetical protein
VRFRQLTIPNRRNGCRGGASHGASTHRPVVCRCIVRARGPSGYASPSSSQPRLHLALRTRILPRNTPASKGVTAIRKRRLPLHTPSSLSSIIYSNARTRRALQRARRRLLHRAPGEGCLPAAPCQATRTQVTRSLSLSKSPRVSATRHAGGVGFSHKWRIALKGPHRSG